MIDDSSTFMESSGRYSGDGAKKQESIYNDLYNGSSMFNRSLSKVSYAIVKPRLSICLLGHPSQFIQYIQEERANKDDRLIQRILCNAPKPQFYSMNIIKESRTAPKLFSLNVFFYAIHRYHKKTHLDDNGEEASINIEYTFDNDAKDAFNNYYNDCKRTSARINNIDKFIV